MNAQTAYFTTCFMNPHKSNIAAHLATNFSVLRHSLFSFYKQSKKNRCSHLEHIKDKNGKVSPFPCYKGTLLLLSLGPQPSAGYGILVSRGFLITHNEAPQSVGLPLDE
jgi:hypothetical protein